MKQANVDLKIDKFGSTIPLTGVTPAELFYLVADHHQNAGGDPVVTLTETGEAVTFTGEMKKNTKGVDEPVLRPRSESEELARLRMKYPSNRLGKIFGGYAPRLPETFEEARKGGIGMVLPSNNLVDHKLAL